MKGKAFTSLIIDWTSLWLACLCKAVVTNTIFLPINFCRIMRYYFEEFIIAKYSGDARAEVIQSVKYFGKSLPLLKIYQCEQSVLHSTNSPISSSTSDERLHNSFTRTANMAQYQNFVLAYQNFISLAMLYTLTTKGSQIAVCKQIIFMNIEEYLLKKKANITSNIYTQIVGILNAYDPINFVTSQKPSCRLSRNQLQHHG